MDQTVKQRCGNSPKRKGGGVRIINQRQTDAIVFKFIEYTVKLKKRKLSILDFRFQTEKQQL